MKIGRPRDFGWVALVLFAVAMFSSSAFQECVGSTSPSYHHQDGRSTFFSVLVYVVNWSRLSCAGGFIRESKDEVLAGFTVLLAFFTLSLWSATNKLADDAKQSAGKTLTEMRKEFVASHRPKLIVRQISLSNSDSVRVSREPLGAQFMVVNTGYTPAIIIRTSARLWLTEPLEDLPAVPPYAPPIARTISIAPGEAVLIPHTESPETSSEERMKSMWLKIGLGRRQEKANSGLLLLGFVVYRDDNRVSRTTAFLREYRYDVQRFEPITHPDYEYQD